MDTDATLDSVLTYLDALVTKTRAAALQESALDEKLRWIHLQTEVSSARRILWKYYFEIQDVEKILEPKQSESPQDWRANYFMEMDKFSRKARK